MLLDLSLLALAILSVVLFVRVPTNLATIIGALNGIFLILPALLYLYFRPSFMEYSMGLLNTTSADFPYTDVRLFMLFVCSGWFVGSLVTLRPRAYKSHVNIKSSARGLRGPMVLLVATLSAAVFLLSFGAEGGSLAQAFLPDRVVRGEQNISPYVEIFVIMTPTFLACVYISVRRKIDPWFIVLSMMALAFALGTAQRRTFIIVFVSIAVSFLLARHGASGVRKTGYHLRGSTKSLRRRITFFLGLSAALGPCLWYLRNLSTQWVRDAGAPIVDSASMRGFWELFFGSTAGGFQGIALVLGMLRESSSSTLHSVWFVLTSPIPRSLWADKPLAPGYLVESFYGLSFSPSLFLVPELILNFHILAPVVAFLIAVLAGSASNFFLRSSHAVGRVRARHPVFNQILYGALLAHAVMIFKNGFALFLVSFTYSAVIAWVVYVVATKPIAAPLAEKT